MQKAIDIVKDVLSRNRGEHERQNKIVIVSQWVSYLRLLKSKLANTRFVNLVLLYGKTTMEQRQVSWI